MHSQKVLPLKKLWLFFESMFLKTKFEYSNYYESHRDTRITRLYEPPNKKQRHHNQTIQLQMSSKDDSINDSNYKWAANTTVSTIQTTNDQQRHHNQTIQTTNDQQRQQYQRFKLQMSSKDNSINDSNYKWSAKTP